MKEFFIKNGAYILGFLGVFFAPISTAIWGIVTLIAIDTITGIWAAQKAGGWKTITSSKLKSIISKVFIYIILIITSRILELIKLDFVSWVDMAVGIIAIVELKSIWENASKILGFDIWKYLRAYLIKGKTGVKEVLNEEDN